MNRPRIRNRIFLTMAIVVAIPVVVLSLMLAVLSGRNEDLRRLDRFRYAQSYLSALIEDRNRLVIARTALVSEDPRLFAALEDPSTMHQKILLLMAEYGLDGHILSSTSDSGSLHLLDLSITRSASGLSAPAQPVVSPSAILLFHSETLESGNYRLTGIGSIKRSEFEVLRAGIGAEVDIIHRDDPLGTRIMTTNRDGFGRNRAGTPIEPPLDPVLSPALHPDHDQPLGPEQRYVTSTGEERTARLMALPPILGTSYAASISFPHSKKAISEVVVYLIASTFITIILAILASHILARQLVDPIQTLLHGIDNLSIAIDAENEFQPLPLPAKDEIGELTEAYNRMGVRLQGAYTSLASQNEALKELDSIKDQFLATTSRELRTPLNTIIALADSMAAIAAPDSIQDRNLRRIADTGRKLNGMVNDILDYTRLEHSDIVLSTRTFELKPLVDTVLRFCSSIKRPGTELINVIEPGRLIHGDEARLEQVFYKLMGRAMRFTTNGTITIRSWEDESILHISVTKTGDTNGIRGNIDQTKGVPGARQESQPELPDLDLVIASHLIHLHGGELELEDDAGRMAIIRLSARIPSDQITADPIPETHTSPATGQAPGALPPA